MFKVMYRTAAVAVLASLPVGANALNFTVTQFADTALTASQTDYSNIRAASFGTIFATEDFEDAKYKVGQIGATDAATLSTAVGTFTTIGGKGTGDTAIDEFNTKTSSRGNNLAIREDGDAHPNGGRQNTSFTTASDNTYLDSNDTLGFEWVAGTADGDLFDRLLFTITDPTDQGKELTISAAGFTKTFTIAPREADGEIFNVLVGFSTGVSSATLLLEKSGTNDGFSFDNATVGAVPLPAAAWLLLAASGGLIAAKRRSARRDA
jgi:hypothetical protein